MYLYRSNQTEQLVAKLAALHANPIGGPLQSECIVVQGKGMERWLTMELAKRHGVWANPDFPFPRSIIERAMATVLGTRYGRRWDSNSLTWAIAEALHSLQGDRSFAVIRGFLRGDSDNRKLMQLSRRVAKVFDGYAIYRPELLQQWQTDNEGHWQAALWRRIASTHELHHSSALEQEFLQILAASKGAIPGFPSRLSLFGIGSLPPLYLRIFAALATRIDVHLFALSPSQEYWADIRTRRDVLRAELSGAEEGPLEVGNALLASLGRLHRDFQYVLERDVDYVEIGDTYNEPKNPGTALGALQSDVLNLRDRSMDDRRTCLSQDDRSISIHSCHSPLREMEVLRDQIFAIMEADPTIETRDIIVMSPDIESYAPFIDAVFSERFDGQDQLPFHIADRAPRATHQVLDAFARLLDLLPGRLTGPAVLDLLSSKVVRERFGIEADEIRTIQTWIAESGIRWGRDAQHREAVGQPATQQNTWRFGLDRLFLGYASPASGLALFKDCLAYDDLEGKVADLLGRFADYCEALFAVQEPFKLAHRMDRWQVLLETALESLVVSDDDNASEHQLLRESFDSLRSDSENFSFTEKLSLSALLPLLNEAWQDSSGRSNFLSGGLSFCQLTPMRSIPHRVVCVIGMNDGAFPRTSHALGFDIVANNPRLGDRSPRDDDRYLFLEALLSARDALRITYTGQSHHTGQSLPPSVLVGELLDVLDESFEWADGEKASSRLHVRHPLQAFSPRYFDSESPELYSYSDLSLRGALSLNGEQEPESAFVTHALPAPETIEKAGAKVVPLADFLKFFVRGSQYFVNQRVGVRLEEADDQLESREPLELEPLAKWHIGDRLLRSMLEHGNTLGAARALQASGAVPMGTPGQLHLQNEMPLIEAIVEQARHYQEGGRLPNIEVDLHLGDTRIVGHLDSLWARCRQEISYSTLAGRRELAAWIKHLILCQETPEGYPRNTVSVGRDRNQVSAISFRPVADPGPLLRDMLELYCLGQRVPLPLFTQSSRAFAQHWMRALARDEEASDEDSMMAARKAYLGGEFARGPRPDVADLYVQQLFAGVDPLHPNYCPVEEAIDGYRDFKSVAMKVYAPLLDHREHILG